MSTFDFDDMRWLFKDVFGKEGWQYSFDAMEKIFTAYSAPHIYTQCFRISSTTNEDLTKYHNSPVVPWLDYETQEGQLYYYSIQPAKQTMRLVFEFRPTNCVVWLQYTEAGKRFELFTIYLHVEAWDQPSLELIKRHLEKVVHHDLYSPALPL